MDVELFAIWCDAVVRQRDATEQVRKHGAVIEQTVFNKNGQPTGTPLLNRGGRWCCARPMRWFGDTGRGSG